jgi:hypothetical protein
VKGVRVMGGGWGISKTNMGDCNIPPCSHNSLLSGPLCMGKALGGV